jgi:hypothetical protein
MDQYVKINASVCRVSSEPTIAVWKNQQTMSVQAARSKKHSMQHRVVSFETMDSDPTLIRVSSQRSPSTGFLHHHSLYVGD